MESITLYAGSGTGDFANDSNMTGYNTSTYAYYTNAMNDSRTVYTYTGAFSITSNLPLDAIVTKITIGLNGRMHVNGTGYTVTCKVCARIDGFDQAYGSTVTHNYTTPQDAVAVYTSGSALDLSNLTDGKFMVKGTWVISPSAGALAYYSFVTVEYRLPSVGLEMGCVF